MLVMPTSFTQARQATEIADFHEILVTFSALVIGALQVDCWFYETWSGRTNVSIRSSGAFFGIIIWEEMTRRTFPETYRRLGVSPGGKFFRFVSFVRACLLVVWLPSEIRSQILPPTFSPSSFGLGAFRFPVTPPRKPPIQL